MTEYSIIFSRLVLVYKQLTTLPPMSPHNTLTHNRNYYQVYCKSIKRLSWTQNHYIYRAYLNIPVKCQVTQLSDFGVLISVNPTF